MHLLDGFARYRQLPDPGYLTELVDVIREQLPNLRSQLPDPGDPEIVRGVDSLRHEIRLQLGMPVADWDLLPPAGYGGVKDTDPGADTVRRGSSPPRVPVTVFLESMRSPFNVGSIIRTVEALGAMGVIITPDCPQIGHPRVRRSARGAERFVPVRTAPLQELSTDTGTLIALEPGGEDIRLFRFPHRGVLLVGSEEFGLSSAARGSAAAVVSVSMFGVKGSLNAAVACGIALHAWCAQIRESDKDA